MTTSNANANAQQLTTAVRQAYKSHCEEQHDEAMYKFFARTTKDLADSFLSEKAKLIIFKHLVDAEVELTRS